MENTNTKKSLSKTIGLNKLDVYIIKGFLTTFVWILLFFILIIIVFDVAEKLDDFIQEKTPLGEIVMDYYINFIPFLLNMFSPIFIFLATILFTSKLGSKSEFIAILSGGVSYLRIMRPYIISAAILAGLTFYLNGWIIPKAEKVRMKFEKKYMQVGQHDYKTNIDRKIGPNTIIHFEYFNQDDSTGGATIIEHLNGVELSHRTHASRIAWSYESNKWRLYNCVSRTFNGDGSITIKKDDFIDTTLNFHPEDFFRRPEYVQSFSRSELNKFIKEQKEKGAGDIEFYETERARRYATPFSVFVLIIIGMCISSRKSRGGLGLHMAMGLIFIVLYLFLAKYFLSMGAVGTINPTVAAWAPNLIFGIVAYVIYQKAQK